MAQGRLSVYWENSPAQPELRRYRSNFAEYRGESGAQTPRMFRGTEALRRFLISMQAPTMMTERAEDRADEWLKELHSKGFIGLDQVELTSEDAESYRQTM